MPVVDAKALFAHAIKRDYALAAFNISSLDSLQAVLWAAEAEASPVIAQVLRLTEEYVRDVETYLDAVRLYAGRCKVPVLLQHDHCSSVEEAKLAIDRGFGAVMYDGSSLSFEENAANSAEVARYAHERGVWLEAELGSIPGMEDNCFTDRVEYTSPELARRFISETGCDSLAVSVGTAHGGVAGNEHLPLDFDRLEALLVEAAQIPSVSRDDVIVSNVRHYEALTHALDAIRRVREGLDDGLSGDFISQDLRECLFHLSDIVGEVTTNEVLGNIFRQMSQW